MSRRRRPELFPADRGLLVRMVAVTVLTPLVVAVAIALVVLLLPLKFALGVGGVTLLGLIVVWSDRDDEADERALAEGDKPELQAIVDRLCALADLPRPRILLHDEQQANSWVVDPLGGRPRLHVTRGLLELLDPAELEAVVAHELCHVAHRDAAVMTVVGLPVAALQKGATDGPGWWGPVTAGRLISGAVGFVAGFGSTALSRHRELSADAGAAALTGRPAALASALMKISGGLALVPKEDLRVAAGWDTLHVVAVGKPHWLWRLHGPTHPSVERRVAALERLEHRLAHGRRVA
jgi:heat shock protein HtpX